jgi:hypothetical protein
MSRERKKALEIKPFKNREDFRKWLDKNHEFLRGFR